MMVPTSCRSSRGGGDPVEPVQLAAARDLVCAPGPERREQRETRQGHRNDLDIARGGESIPERHAEPPEPQHQEEVTRLRHPVLGLWGLGVALWYALTASRNIKVIPMTL